MDAARSIDPKVFQMIRGIENISNHLKDSGLSPRIYLGNTTAQKEGIIRFRNDDSKRESPWLQGCLKVNGKGSASKPVIDLKLWPGKYDSVRDNWRGFSGAIWVRPHAPGLIKDG
jgi:hypothetical protein